MHPCIQVVLVLTALKLLLVPAYRSTDFEVHRNWLAITHSLPLQQWYIENRSEWTLDYPPLFAWFEWALSQVAKHVDAGMLVVSKSPYASPSTILFQRLTVMASDALLLSAAYAFARRHATPQQAAALFLLVSSSAGLLIVDHIHFQYNGALLGLLLWSLYAASMNRQLLCGALFAALVNAKHLAAYAGPVYLIYLLRAYCCTPKVSTSVQRFVTMGAVVAAVCGFSLGPFLAMGQARQLLGRLFPFGRGLVHSYWAANVWAVYCAADKVLAVLLPHLGFPVQRSIGNLTGGIVGDVHFSVLPQVSPAATSLLVLASLLPCLLHLWRVRPLQPAHLTFAVAYSYLCGFVFGFHVHEKAALMVLAPLALTAVHSRAAAADFLVLSTAATYGLLPLLFGAPEHPIKLLIAILYFALTWSALHATQAAPQLKMRNKIIGTREEKQEHSLGGLGHDGDMHSSLPSQQASHSAGSSDDFPATIATQQIMNEQTSAHTADPHVLGNEGRGHGWNGSKLTSANIAVGDPVLFHMSGSKGSASRDRDGRPLLTKLQGVYVAGFIPLELFTSLLHPVLFSGRLPYLPLMATSLYCCLGVLWVWVRMAWACCTGAPILEDVGGLQAERKLKDA